jgi:polyisoprenyl-phosphate glycosyltransferase
MANSKKLAVIIPVFNEGGVISENLEEIRQEIGAIGMPYEILLVDDGSADNSWAEIAALAESFDEIRAIRFSRNFGKEAAILAGLENADADLFLIMDSDLQHPPQHVKGMLDLLESEQTDIVNGVKSGRIRESIIYRLFAGLFYRILRLLTGLELKNSSDFKIINCRVADALRRFEEKSLFFRGLVSWVGFKAATYYYTPGQRERGVSSFSKPRLLRLAQHSTLAFTGKPLYLTIIAGLIFLIISLLLGIQTLYNYLSGSAVSGFTTVILLILFTGSLILISLGIIGVYLSMIYDETKNRPRFIIAEQVKGESGEVR